MTSLTAYLAEYDRMAEQQDAMVRDLDVYVPDWQEREQYGERYISEDDIADVNDDEGIPNEDWDAFIEMMFVDPAERDI